MTALESFSRGAGRSQEASGRLQWSTAHLPAAIRAFVNTAFQMSRTLPSGFLFSFRSFMSPSRAVFALGLAALFAVTAGHPKPDWPEIVGVDVDKESLGHHHTHHYRMEEGYVVRRMC